MTLASSTARVSYDGDGATASFSTAFSFLENSHVKVVHRSTTGVETTWVLGTQYTLTGAGTGAAGTVTVATSPTDYTPASGERLVILRNVPLTQNRDLPAAGPFPSATVEGGLDQLTMMVQQIAETLARTLRFGETSDATATLPDPAANNLIGWNSAGTNLTNIALTAITAAFDTVLTGLADGDFLSYDAASSKWINRTPAEVRGDIDAMQDVFTTRGDLVIATTGGDAARLAKGTSGQVLTMGADEPAWSTPATPESFPAGAIVDYAGTSAPTGWLLCYGQAISRTTYSTLFTAIGTTYGAGDGSTTFNLPDLRGRVTAGKDNMGGTSANRLTDQSGGLDGDTLGDTGGSETHTLTSGESGVPAHTHGVAFNNAGTAGGTALAGFNAPANDSETTDANSAANASSAHNNVQPTIILNKIIKT